jgi:uncharacterized protein (DUF305 family)
MTDSLVATAEPIQPDSHRSVRTVLIAVIAVAVLAIAVTGGFLWGSHGKTSATHVSAVDTGFARDMATHHQQAVTMAAYARDNSTNVLVKTDAFDIESSQSVQLGIMTGWLEQWGVSRNTQTPMAWMAGHHHLGANGLMPGMATPAQMTKLQSLHGSALNIFFLQLMIRHHQGGIEMAQYAAQHASEPYVRNLAQKIYDNQTAEIVQMEQLLRQLGGSPLSPPSQ